MTYLKKIITTSIMIIVSGCSIVQVHEPWPRHIDTEAPTIREAVQLAHRAEDQLIKKIGDQTLFRNTVAITEILLAGALGGAALTDVSDDILIAGSVAGVTGLGLATWLESKPRQRVYLLGIKALVCSVDAVTAYQAVTPFDTDLRRLDQTIIDAESQILRFNQFLAVLQSRNSPENIVVNLIKDQVEKAKLDLNNANKIYESGVDLETKISETGGKLENTVDRIMSLVTEGVLLTESELSQLRSLIQDLVFQAPDFIKVPERIAFPFSAQETSPELESDANKTDVEVDNELLALLDTMTEFNSAIASMNGAARVIESKVRSVDGANPIEKLSKCGVDIDSVVIPLSTDLTEVIKFNEGVEGDIGFSVEGGNGQYSGNFVGSHPGLTYDQVIAFGSDFTILANQDTKPGNYRFRVSDITGAKITVPIQVNSKQETPDTDEETAQSGDEQVKDLQDILKEHGFMDSSIPSTGNRLEITNAAIQSFLDTIQLPKKAEDISTTSFGDLWVDVINQLDTSGVNTQEIPKRIRNLVIEKLLNINGQEFESVDGQIDDSTIKAIRIFSNDDQLNPTTDEELDAVLKSLREKGLMLEEEKSL